MDEMSSSHHHDDPLGGANGHGVLDDDEVTTTTSGRQKPQTRHDPFTSRLPDEFFDELREKRGLGRKLTRLRGVELAKPDPIVADALRKVAAQFGTRAGEIEDLLASQYLSDVEAVTSRLNARQLPRLTRLLLSQRGVYVKFLAAAIQKVEARSQGTGPSHSHSHSHSHSQSQSREHQMESTRRERRRGSKAKTVRRNNARSAD